MKEKIDIVIDRIAQIVAAIFLALLSVGIYINLINTNTRKATVYLKCPYPSYSVVSQEVKDRSHSILKLDKKNDTDVFAGADGLFYSARYVSKDIIDITAIGYEDSNDTRIFKIRLKED
jgi:hypothetical protein